MTAPTHEEQIAALERAVRAAGKADGLILCSIIERLTPPSPVLPTLIELSTRKELSGKGFNRARLKAWGVPWPPPRGWLQKLLKEAAEREDVS